MFWQTDCFQELSLLFIIALTAFFVGRRRGFFLLAENSFKKNITFAQVISAFATFFSLTLFLGWVYTPLTSRGAAYYGLAIFFVALGGLMLFALGKKQRKIWGTFSAKSFLYGALSWFIAYPLAGFIGKIAACYMESVYDYKDPSQLIAEQILSLKLYPFLFTLVVLTTIFLVPLAEEILFRGFIQNFLMRKMPRLAAITLTALLFTAAHYNVHQGLGNVEILITLFVLSLFLGFVYEKWQSLASSLALHQVFNAISFIGLLLT